MAERVPCQVGSRDEGAVIWANCLDELSGLEGADNTLFVNVNDSRPGKIKDLR